MRLRGLAFSTNGRGDLVGTVIAYSDHGEPLGVEHAGNYSKDAAKGLAGKLAAVGMDREVAQAQVVRLLADLRKSADTAWESGPPKPAHGLPILYPRGAPFREVLDQAWEALLAKQAAAPPIYYRLGDALVAIDPDHPRVAPLTIGSLRTRLSRAADFIVTGPSDTERPVPPPRELLESMLAEVPLVTPALTGVARGAFVAPDGAVVQTPGYHAQTGLYLTSDSAIPPVPERPTASDIAEARRLLLDELLGGFPFVGTADVATAVAAVLLPFVRPMIVGPTPLHVVSAPVEGSGKGLLTACVVIIATGEAPPVRTEAGSDDEWRKRLTAALLGAPSVLLLDNLRRILDSAALAAALTATIWTDRLLGASREVNLPIRVTWLATANNPSYSGEMARRVVSCRIDAGVERPGERTGFQHPDLTAWVRENRPRLVWAALVLARTWVVAGSPPGREVMGSFEAWATTIGGILEVAGIPGLLGNRAEAYAAAAVEGEAWRGFLDVWWSMHGEARVGVAELFDLATRERLLTDLKAGRTDRGARTSLGMELARLRDRIFGPFVIRAGGASPESGAAMYRLERRNEAGGREKVPEVQKTPPWPG